jgi:hypothetical protein
MAPRPRWRSLSSRPPPAAAVADSAGKDGPIMASSGSESELSSDERRCCDDGLCSCVFEDNGHSFSPRKRFVRGEASFSAGRRSRLCR